MAGLRLLYLGTPEFAVPALRALAASRHEIVGVISQPDRPRGRGRRLAPTPVRSAAEELGIDVLQPEKVGSEQARAWMEALRPDLGVVVAFGQFVPRKVRELPPHRMINGHASLLPRWRGAAPIEWAIAGGDARTGISVMRLEKEMDAGDVCLVRPTRIGADETAGELAARLAPLAGEALVEATDAIADGTARFLPQDPAGVTLAPKIDREFARLDWTASCERVYARIRAATPRPGADVTLERASTRLRIVECRPCVETPPGPPGAVRADAGRMRVAASDGWIELRRVQAPGRRPVGAAEYLRGAPLEQDERVAP